MNFSKLFSKYFLVILILLLITNYSYMQSPNVVITGKVTGYSPMGVASHAIIVVNGTPADITLDLNGEFSYDIPGSLSGPFKIEIRNNKDFLNGVNVGDIIKIQNHILGKTQLTQPYKFIAADVRGDGNITVSDIKEIRSLILGNTDKFVSDKSWTFFDATNPITVNNWASVPQFIMYDPNNPVNIHFRAVKNGNVD